MCAGAGKSVSSRFSVNSSNHSEKSRTRTSEARLLSLFFFVLSFFGESRQFPSSGSPLRSVAGLERVLDESCGGDVEHELVPELDDNPSCITSSSLFGQVWLLTLGSLISISVFFAELSKW